MRTFKVIMILCLNLFAIVALKAQTKDYYPGKWDVMIYGTPYGDVKRVFGLERKDGKLTGTVQDTTGIEKIQIASVEEADKKAAINYTTQGYDATLLLEPVDDNHVKGTLAGFDAEGVRRKEN